MKISNRILTKLFVTVSLLSLLIGCAIMPKSQLTTSTIDFNKIVEKSQNEMLLLNIMRASKRYPTYFTSFSVLRGNMSYTLSTGSISIPFGKIGTGLNGAYSVAPSIIYATNPGFDLAVLDTQEFTRGIMTPVPLCTIDYYWNQGWPRELLLHLFIERFEEVNEKGEIKEFNNNPPNKKDFTDFQEKLRSMSCNMKSTTYNSFGPKLPLVTEENFKIFAEGKKSGLDFILIRDDDKKDWYQLKSSYTEYNMECVDKPKENNESEKNTTVKAPTQKDKPTGRYLAKNDEPAKSGTIGKIYIRSPEAIIYYLGEIVRAELEGIQTPEIQVNERCEKPVPLFRVQKSSILNDDAVSVEFEESRYAIKKDIYYGDSCKAERSMHVLSLISQLIGQQKKIEQVPVTGVVNVIGR